MIEKEYVLERKNSDLVTLESGCRIYSKVTRKYISNSNGRSVRFNRACLVLWPVPEWMIRRNSEFLEKKFWVGS